MFNALNAIYDVLSDHPYRFDKNVQATCLVFLEENSDNDESNTLMIRRLAHCPFWCH